MIVPVRLSAIALVRNVVDRDAHPQGQVDILKCLHLALGQKLALIVQQAEELHEQDIPLTIALDKRIDLRGDSPQKKFRDELVPLSEIERTASPIHHVPKVRENDSRDIKEEKGITSTPLLLADLGEQMVGVRRQFPVCMTTQGILLYRKGLRNQNVTLSII